MLKNEKFYFPEQVEPLATEDQRLVDAYFQIGKTVDDLAYTEDLDKLLALIKVKPTDQNRKKILNRLYRLRKAARLPRLVRRPASDLQLSLL